MQGVQATKDGTRVLARSSTILGSVALQTAILKEKWRVIVSLGGVFARGIEGILEAEGRQGNVQSRVGDVGYPGRERHRAAKERLNCVLSLLIE